MLSFIFFVVFMPIFWNVKICRIKYHFRTIFYVASVLDEISNDEISFNFIRRRQSNGLHRSSSETAKNYRIIMTCCKFPVLVAKKRLHGDFWVHRIRVKIEYLRAVWRFIYRLNGILPTTSMECVVALTRIDR